ncbi:MAG: class I SAM-dependent methyltransferase [Kiritimatiellia bacterium]|jgi:predicted O-methyltransferase YrrM|nr:class I SAM-dependent methyltransferase [Kiritimatiellia bacterium]
MKRRALAILSICTALSSINLGVLAEDDPKSIECRQEFIDDFKHRIMDTAAEDAMLLRILVEASTAKRGVEVGTYRAFGAINMGIGFERTGGHLYTVEINNSMVLKARESLKHLALDKSVTVVEGDALKVLPKMEGEYDFVFIDAVKRDYMRYFKDLEPKLSTGAVIASDNTIGSAGQMKDFLTYVNTDPHYDSVTIRATMKKNDGITITYRISDGKKGVDKDLIAARDKVIRAASAKTKYPTAVDSILLRILAEAAQAKKGIEIGIGNGIAAINMGIAFERTGGTLQSVDGDSELASAARSNIKAAKLEKTVTVTGGDTLKVLANLDGKYDFVHINGDKNNYLPCFKAIEDKLKAGAIIVADNSLVDTDDIKGFLAYVKQPALYETVHLRPENKALKDGVLVIYKVR